MDWMRMDGWIFILIGSSGEYTEVLQRFVAQNPWFSSH